MNEPLEYRKAFTFPFRIALYSLVVFLPMFLDIPHAPQALAACLVGTVHFEMYQLNHRCRLTGRPSRGGHRLFHSREFAVPLRWALHTGLVLSFMNAGPSSPVPASFVLVGVLWMAVVVFEVLQAVKD